MTNRLLITLISLFSVFQATAQYCPPTGTGCSLDNIESFSTTGGSTNITNNATGCASGGYTYYSTMAVTAIQGNSFNFSITNGLSWGSSEYFTIWVDWNKDNDFLDANENCYQSPASATTGQIFTGSINVPAGATVGTTRLRLMVSYGSAGTSCATSGGDGEVEDYNVVVVSACTAPAITAQPQNPPSVCEGGAVTYSITATGAATYKWQVNSGTGFVDVSNGGKYSGATTNTLSITNIPSSFNNSQYRCIATAACAASTTSAAASLSITPLVSITSIDVLDTTCAGITKDLQVLVSGPVTSYTWETGTFSNGFYEITSANTPPYDGIHTGTLKLINTPDSLIGHYFHVNVTGVCNSVTSDDIELFVIATPYLTTQPIDQVVTQGASASFYAEAEGENFMYQWQASSDGGLSFSNCSNPGLYFGYNSTQFVVLSSDAKNHWKFRCLIISTDKNCGIFSDTSDVAELVISNPTGVSGLEQADFNIYPNPNSDNILYINTTNISGKESQLRVVDNLGRIVLNKTMRFTAAPEAINIEKFVPGVYHLHIIQDNGSIYEQRFIRQ